MKGTFNRAIKAVKKGISLSEWMANTQNASFMFILFTVVNLKTPVNSYDTKFAWSKALTDSFW